MKKTFILFILGIALLSLPLFLAGCGDSSSGGGGYANTDVQYTVSGDKITHNANFSRTYTIPGAGTEYWELTWYCGNYKDHRSQTIKLTFKKTNNTWFLDKEDISGGSCQ